LNQTSVYLFFSIVDIRKIGLRLYRIISTIFRSVLEDTILPSSGGPDNIAPIFDPRIRCYSFVSGPFIATKPFSGSMPKTSTLIDGVNSGRKDRSIFLSEEGRESV
jgi:hypothetical protein